MAQYVHITDHADLARDISSMGVVNTNRLALEAARRKRQQALIRLEEDQRHRSEVNILRNEVAELKAMILQLLHQSGAK